MTALWKPLGETPPVTLSIAHQQPHHLSQWLARFARGYLEPAADDSHTSLTWRRDLSAMTTREAQIDGGKLALAMNPRALSLAVLVDGGVTEEFPAHGRNDAEAGRWVKEKLNDYGLDPAALDAPSPYEMPPSPYTQGAAYNALSEKNALTEICRYYENADLVIAAAAEPYRNFKPGPSPVRIWPHHFDIAMTIALEEGEFETAQSIGAGLAVPDRLSPEFYWYAYPWPNNSFNALSDIGGLERYRLKDFSGLALPMSTAVAAKDQQGAVAQFYSETIGFFIDLLKRG